MKEINNFKVSIIMNCYNGEKFLKESINSVINQTFKNWEIIFFDNILRILKKNLGTNFLCKNMTSKEDAFMIALR